MTSTPFSHQSRSRSSVTAMNETQSTFRRNERTQSGNDEQGNSQSKGTETWETPGEMSQSFSGEEIPLEIEMLRDDDPGALGSETSVPLNDASLVKIEPVRPRLSLILNDTGSHSSSPDVRHILKPLSPTACPPGMFSCIDRVNDLNLFSPSLLYKSLVQYRQPGWSRRIRRQHRCKPPLKSPKRNVSQAYRKVRSLAPTRAMQLALRKDRPGLSPLPRMKTIM